MPVKTVKDIVIFIILVVLAIIFAKWVGNKIPAVGKITEQI